MKKKILKNRNFVGGILLAVFALGILATLAFFLFAKYSRPAELAEFLPADDTLFFAELQLDDDATQLSKIFADESGDDIFGVDSLGFSQPGNLLGLAGNRIGLAFFGEKIDPQNFVLIFDIADETAAREFLENETLDGESLATENFRGQKIYYFPTSRALAATFFDGNIVLASSRANAQKIVGALAAPENSLENSAGFRAVAAKINPRANFIFCAPRFLDNFFANRFSGLQKVFTAPLLEKFAAGGANFAVENGNLKIDARLILTNESVAANPFLLGENLDSDVLNFFGAEDRIVFASENLSAQLAHFFGQNSTLAAIAKSESDALVENWLGENFADEVAAIFESPTAVATTESGGFVAVVETDLENFFEKLKSATGKIAAGEKIVVLPDQTTGRELTVGATNFAIEEEFFASQKVATLEFPNYKISFAQLDGFAIFGTEKSAVEKMVGRFVGEEKFLADEIPSGENLFFVRLDGSENPLLRPFIFALAGVNFASDEIKIELRLQK